MYANLISISFVPISSCLSVCLHLFYVDSPSQWLTVTLHFLSVTHTEFQFAEPHLWSRRSHSCRTRTSWGMKYIQWCEFSTDSDVWINDSTSHIISKRSSNQITKYTSWSPSFLIYHISLSAPLALQSCFHPFLCHYLIITLTIY